MGYCQITDVTNAFPSFQRNAPGSIQDIQIQAWIDQYGAEIRALLMKRGFDPLNPPGGVSLTPDQANWLTLRNADVVIGELGRALEGNVTLQPGEISTVAGRRKNYEKVMADVSKGEYDAFFGVPSRLWGSIGGAETDKSTPGQRGENRAFGRNQEF
jgi:hypothetical protein